jgi:hypothetical protein
MDSNNNREWYDFSIENNKENYFMPVNIKVSELDAPDNLNCKLGIFYALTGCNPKDVDLNNGDSWKQFFKKTNEYMGTDENKDYYFLVVNKNDTSDIFWNSLKSLNELKPNGNNLPFQCSWRKNRTRVERNYKESRKFILDNLDKSIKLRESIGATFRDYLNDYLDEGDTE